MTSMEDAQIELLKRQYEEDRARVWANPTIPPGMKQAEVNALCVSLTHSAVSYRRRSLGGRFRRAHRGFPYPLSRGAP